MAEQPDLHEERKGDCDQRKEDDPPDEKLPRESGVWYVCTIEANCSLFPRVLLPRWKDKLECATVEESPPTQT